MNIKLSEIAVALGGKMFGKDREISHIVTDNREITDGNTLFLAIKGEKVDGHKYVASVLNDSSCGALIDNTAYVADGTVLVGDVTCAIADLGRYYRNNYIPGVCCIAVTGSVGKTTTKDMIACAMSSRQVYKSRGNRNSKFTAPLALMEAPDDISFLISELGMSEKGEMAVLSRTVCPDICVITNIGSSHIEQLGSRENIRDEKLAITSYMRKDGILILNGDDVMLKNYSGKAVFYAIDNKDADFYAENIYEYEDKTIFTVCYNNGTTKELLINTVGMHNVLNALAAFAVGICAGLTAAEIAEGLKAFMSTGVRQNIYTKNGIRIIADCYNASPESMRAALAVLRNAKGRKVAVLGDMLELGTYSEGLHVALGREARECGVDVLLSYGDFAYSVCEAYGGGTAFELERREAFINALNETLREGDTVLFKASNRLKFFDIINILGLCQT